MNIINNKLALYGGKPIRNELMPTRNLITFEEKKAIVKYIDNIITSNKDLTYGGNFQKVYENNLTDLMGGGYGVAVNSGTNALFIALQSLNFNFKSEIIVPSITDPGGVMPVVLLGFVPIVSDTDSRSYNVCLKQILKKVSKYTKAIIVAHIGGDVVDLDPIIKYSKKNNIILIEDCSQAHGAKYKGKLVGSFGDLAIFSTMSGKHFCTGAQGGFIYTKNENLYWELKRYTDRGKPFNSKHTKNLYAGLNSNFTDLSAVIGSVQLKKLSQIINKRVIIAECIKKNIKKCKVLSFGWQVPNTNSSYWFIKLKLKLNMIKTKKEVFCNALEKEGVVLQPHYRHIAAEDPWFKNKYLNYVSPYDSNFKNDNDMVNKLINAMSVTDSHFNLIFNENYTDKEIKDIQNSFLKVENYFLK